MAISPFRKWCVVLLMALLTAAAVPYTTSAQDPVPTPTPGTEPAPLPGGPGEGATAPQSGYSAVPRAGGSSGDVTIQAGCNTSRAIYLRRYSEVRNTSDTYGFHRSYTEYADGVNCTVYKLMTAGTRYVNDRQQGATGWVTHYNDDDMSVLSIGPAPAESCAYDILVIGNHRLEQAGLQSTTYTTSDTC